MMTALHEPVAGPTIDPLVASGYSASRRSYVSEQIAAYRCVGDPVGNSLRRLDADRRPRGAKRRSVTESWRRRARKRNGRPYERPSYAARGYHAALGHDRQQGGDA